MKNYLYKAFLLLCLFQSPLRAEEIPDVCMRHYAQWKVGNQAQQKVLEKYGFSRISFDQKGRAIPTGLSSKQLPRWERLYESCMRDGCYYCDAEEGSCEAGTCGPKNAFCKPYPGSDGYPQCGLECADYAFLSLLI